MTTPPVYKESYLPGPQNTLFYTRTYTPPAPTPAKALIIFIHGFNEHIARYTHIHTPLSQHRGFAIFTFDQRGFGKTAAKEENGGGKRYALTSWKEQLEDIEWAIGEGRKVEGCESVPVFLMGHSMVCIFFFGRCVAILNRSAGWWPQPSIPDPQRPLVAATLPRNSLPPLRRDRLFTMAHSHHRPSLHQAVGRRKSVCDRSEDDYPCYC
jgi:hypothetical protein